MPASTNQHLKIPIPRGLTDAIRSLADSRAVEHCGTQFQVNPLAMYGKCPQCGAEIKLRSFSAGDEIEDVIDAVLTWINSTAAATHAAEQRAAELREDESD
jgi:hypothetical protein